jgi:hypothetical protein
MKPETGMDPERGMNLEIKGNPGPDDVRAILAVLSRRGRTPNEPATPGRPGAPIGSDRREPLAAWQDRRRAALGRPRRRMP